MLYRWVRTGDRVRLRHRSAYLDDKLDPIYTDRAYNGSATVFQAELHAIHMACEYALMQPHGTVNILSDSQAAIKAVTLTGLDLAANRSVQLKLINRDKS
jgi:ribonuclease HI